jgi:hypothetical protein
MRPKTKLGDEILKNMEAEAAIENSMELLTDPTTEVKDKTIKDFVLSTYDLVFTFTDGTWCYFTWDEEELMGPLKDATNLLMSVETRYRLGLISKEVHEAYAKVAARRVELWTQQGEEERYQTYLELREEFEDPKPVAPTRTPYTYVTVPYYRLLEDKPKSWRLLMREGDLMAQVKYLPKSYCDLMEDQGLIGMPYWLAEKEQLV